MKKHTCPAWALIPALGLSMVAMAPRAVLSAVIDVPGDQPTIQAGINAASNGDTVVVADGIYTGGGNKNLNFNGKAITVRSSQGPLNCIIDCENDGNGFFFENGEEGDSVVDGFTIINGRATYGGGIYIEECSPTILNCILLNNKGERPGGVDGYGGGIYCYDDVLVDVVIPWIEHGPCKPTIANCIFAENSADYGGGIYNYSDGFLSTTEPAVINCTFAGNHSDLEGGGMYNWQSEPTVKNSIFWGDTCGTFYPEIRNISCSPFITYCDIQGGYSGTGNIDADPLFVDEGDYHITLGSPCIDVGTDAGVYEDMDGDARPLLDGFDMGADEYSEPCWDGDFDGYADVECGGDDCADLNPHVFPTNPNPYCDCEEPHPQGTEEIPGDGLDNDCDGKADESCFIAIAAVAAQRN